MEAERRWSVLRTLGAIIGLSFLVWLALVCFDFFGGSKLVVGPETTFVNGPLTTEGLIDYDAALH